MPFSLPISSPPFPVLSLLFPLSVSHPLFSPALPFLSFSTFHPFPSLITATGSGKRYSFPFPSPIPLFFSIFLNY